MDVFTHKTINITRPGINFRRYLYLVSYYFIATVLFVAGVSKIYDPSPLLGALEAILSIDSTLAIIIATILHVVEITIAVFLIISYQITYTLRAAVCLFWIFFVFSLYGYFTGLNIDCGCFGNIITSDFGVGMILRNVIFVAIASVLVLHYKKNTNK